MPVSLRDLLPNVKQFRPDVSDGQIMFFIKDAARKIASWAPIFRATIVKPTIQRGQISVDGGTLHRIHSGNIYEIPDGLTYRGTWDPVLNEPFVGDVPAFLQGAPGLQLGPDLPAGIKSCAGSVTFMDRENILVSMVPVGSTRDNYVTPFYIYNARSSAWSGPFNINGRRGDIQAGSSGSSNNGRSMIPLEGGRVLVLGGIYRLTNPTAFSGIEPPSKWELVSYIIDTSGNIVDGPALPKASRWWEWPKWCKMPDGRIILYGGSSSDSTNSSTLNVMYEVNPKSGAISMLGGSISMQAANHRPTGSFLIPIDDKRIFVTTGCQPGNIGQYPNSLIYNLDTQTFTTVPIGSVKRWPTTWGNFEGTQSTAFCKSSDGGILVWGSTPGSPTSYVDGGVTKQTNIEGKRIERYDPSTNQWSEYASITIPRVGGHAGPQEYSNMYLMQDGTIIASGLYASGSGTTYTYTISKDKDISDFVPARPGAQMGRSVSITVSGGCAFFVGDSTAIPGSELVNNTMILNSLVPGLPEGWYDVKRNGTQLIGTVYDWTKNDILYTFNSKDYVQVKWNTAKTLTQVNQPTVDAYGNNPEANIGFPNSFANTNGAVTFYPTPGAGSEYPIRYDVSYVPSTLDDVDDEGVYDIPPDVEEVIIDGALSRVYDIPGENKSSQLATFHRAAFKRGEANLKAVGMFGYGGTPQYITGNFGASNGFSVTW